MKNAAKTLGVGLVLVATAACGAGGPGEPPAPGAPPVVTTPSDLPTQIPGSPPVSGPPATKPPMSQPTVGPPPADTLLPPSQIDVGKLPSDFPRQVSADKGGVVLNVHADLKNGCENASATLADQNAQRVVITIKLERAEPGDVCTQIFRSVVLPVQLAEPIGARTVVLQAG